MSAKTLFPKVKSETISFFKAVSSSSETAYIVLFIFYLLIQLELKTFWAEVYAPRIQMIRYGLLGVVMWGSALYLFFVIASWRNLWNKNFWLILVGGIILFATWYFSKKMSNNAYGVVMDLFFCLMACGKSFRKMLKCTFGVTVSMLIIAGIGIQAGYTYDIGKPYTDKPGHSLGINYPNTWGYLVFLALIILWYLYLRFKPVITFVIFWAVSAVMFFYILCRTIAGITLIYPFLALAVDLIEKRADRRAQDGTFIQRKKLEWFLIAIPYISWAFMMFSSYQVKWWHKYYHGPLRNLAWRFIQGGLYFDTYGLPLFGNPYKSNVTTIVNVNNEFIEVGILDSSFAAYIIMRGIVWLTYTLAWLCLAHWKALKKRDYAIILIETILLGFAMMERPGLEMWYNFILLYPLAKVVSKPGTEPVLEFDITSNESGEKDTADPKAETFITPDETDFNTFEANRLSDSDKQ